MVKTNPFMLTLIASLGLVAACGDDSSDSADDTQAALLSACEAVGTGVPSWSPFTVTPPSKKYIMALHGCKTSSSDCGNPQNHQVELAESDDGNTWSKVTGWSPFSGSVPEVTRREGFLYIVGAGLAKVNLTTGAVTPSNFAILNEDKTSAMPRDVAFGPKLSDGRLSVVYVPSMQVADTLTDKPVYYAEEIEGSDGSCFQYKSTLATTSGQAFHDITDPDLFFDGTQYVLYTSFGANTHAFTSTAIDGSYSYLRQISSGQGGVPSGVLSEDGSTVFTYVNKEVTMGINAIYRGTALPGAAPSSFTQVISPTGMGDLTTESPSVIRNLD